MELYSIYDSKAQEYGAPQLCKNVDVARRGFRGFATRLSVEDRADYVLVHVGTFNQDTGELASAGVTIVCSAAEFGGTDNGDPA